MFSKTLRRRTTLIGARDRHQGFFVFMSKTKSVINRGWAQDQRYLNKLVPLAQGLARQLFPKKHLQVTCMSLLHMSETGIHQVEEADTGEIVLLVNVDLLDHY